MKYSIYYNMLQNWYELVAEFDCWNDVEDFLNNKPEHMQKYYIVKDNPVVNWAQGAEL